VHRNLLHRSCHALSSREQIPVRAQLQCFCVVDCRLCFREAFYGVRTAPTFTPASSQWIFLSSVVGPSILRVAHLFHNNCRGRYQRKHHNGNTQFKANKNMCQGEREREREGGRAYCICTGDTPMNKTVVLFGSMCSSTHLDHVMRTFRYATTRSISSYLTDFLEKDPPFL
jgi:hypothetical protein